MIDKKKGFTLIELLVVVAIIGILAAIAINFFSGYSLTAKKNVAQANFMTIKNYILAEKARCYLDKTATVFQSEKCPITSSMQGASSGWCGVFGDFFLKKANFKNPFGGGSAYGVGDGSEDGITRCVLCPRGSFCGSNQKGNYKLMWYYDNKLQDSVFITPN
mgnify:FL=1